MPFDIIDKCPSSCELIRAIFAEVESYCRGCPDADVGCFEGCLAYRLLKLIPANFDFGEVRDEAQVNPR